MTAKPMKTLELHYPMIQFLIIHGITSSIPIMRCAYVGLMTLATVIFKAWNKIDMQRSFVVYGISHLSLAFSLYTQSPKGGYSMVYHSKVLHN